ncbi:MULTISPECIES: PLP-dependent aminotransferase family protein [unclassified Variovorax]|uniref:aminotransferase-like domain-containing protein n=1 Tax=unclassified Variovorax TaxID=663243 RepID=UPI003F449ED8
MNWTLASRMQTVGPSIIRDLNKIVARSPHIVSLAAGVPSPETFPVAEFAAACQRVLARGDAPQALQYSATEGLPELREAVAHMLPWSVEPDQVLITNGSQQGLDLVARAFVDPGSRVLVEQPTYPGAVQAFAASQPQIQEVRCSADGIDLDDLTRCIGSSSAAARFLYLLPTFQNPTGRTMSDGQRNALTDVARTLGLPLVEDNPYGELWYDEAPPLPLAARSPENCIYLGTFSKVLAPGMRLGFAVAPKKIIEKLALAKQGADLQPPTFNQHVVTEVMRDGFLDRHIAAIRERYKAQRDAMLGALQQAFGTDGKSSADAMQWNMPGGGMFIWARLPAGIAARTVLPLALERGVAFVPGSAFYANGGDERAVRLSFVTASVPDIQRAITAFASAVRAAGAGSTSAIEGDQA